MYNQLKEVYHQEEMDQNHLEKNKGIKISCLILIQ